MSERVDEAARVLWRHWQAGTRCEALPEACRPASRAEGHAVQSALVGLSGQQAVGWKIAATSEAGQRYLHVDGPIAGRLIAGRVLDDGAALSLAGNLMRVGEAEFAFRLAVPLPPRPEAFAVPEVLDAVSSLHPAIEIPDSRYVDCSRVGAAQLIADQACAAWLVVGAAAPGDWRRFDLVEHRVAATLNGLPAAEGIGRNVLGDPRLALVWLANELRSLGIGLRAGDIVTTGTCLAPVTIAPGDHLAADFGMLGTVSATMAGDS